MKKIWSIIGGVVLMAIFLPTSFAHHFTDTTDYRWKNSIEYLAEENIVKGYDNGTFKPSEKVNRAEFTKMILEGFGYEMTFRDADNCFSDVDVSDWYAQYVCYAKKNDIIDGYPDGSFRPTDPVNQAEALKIMFEAWGEDVVKIDGAWYEQYLEHAEWLGMYYFQQGYPYYDKKSAAAGYEITRGEVAYMIAWLTNPDWPNWDDQISAKEFYGADTNVFAMREEECYEDEFYHEVAMICYLDYSKSEELGEDFEVHDYFNGEPEGDVLARYTIIGDEIDLVYGSGKPEYEEAWYYFAEVIPQKYREEIVSYEIFTDGYDGVLAAVEQTDNDPSKWVLQVDPEDSHPHGRFNKTETLKTLVHELGHVLTLNEDQIDYVELDDQSASYWSDFDNAVEACAPNYFPYEGCSRSDSYINSFFQSFWTSIHEERDQLEYIQDDDEYYDALYEFFTKYEDQFVNDYAVTNPGEDIAESFMYFVFEEIPTDKNVITEKYQFFYGYPELVELRDYIRKEAKL